jgi:hypothetical protein
VVTDVLLYAQGPELDGPIGRAPTTFNAQIGYVYLVIARMFHTPPVLTRALCP